MGLSVMDLIDITHKEASAIINNELMGRISEGSGCLNPEYQYLGIDTDEGPYRVLGCSLHKPFNS